MKNRTSKWVVGLNHSTAVGVHAKADTFVFTITSGEDETGPVVHLTGLADNPWSSFSPAPHQDYELIRKIAVQPGNHD